MKNENFTIFTNFDLKKVKISNFELQKCFVPQKKAENMYNTDLARKSTIFLKKIDFFGKKRFFSGKIDFFGKNLFFRFF